MIAVRRAQIPGSALANTPLTACRVPFRVLGSPYFDVGTGRVKRQVTDYISLLPYYSVGLIASKFAVADLGHPSSVCVFSYMWPTSQVPSADGPYSATFGTLNN
jgi:hypothetical protein